MTIVIFSCDNEFVMNHLSRSADHPAALAPAARWAGYMGVLPFVFALGLTVLGDSQDLASLGLQIAIAWGASILSFIGAVHFGLALAGRLSWSVTTVIGSVLPSVVGAVAVLIAGERGMAILVVGFSLFWLFEHRVYCDVLPPEYLDLRRVLTLLVCALLVLTAFAGSGALS